jgi:aryl-alcohol dehydrogenase-like predicted oxidoreductase
MTTNPIPTRTLGRLTSSAIGFGSMVLSPGVYGDIDDDRAFAALGAALDEGATHIDTSDAYGEAGHNERLVGRALRGSGRRDEVLLATKFGLAIRAGAEAHTYPVNYDFGELKVNAEPRYVRGYAESSLRYLGTDRIDLYYLHFPDPTVPVEDTAGAVAELIKNGDVRHLGLSNVTAEQLARAHAVHPVAAVQVQWSMWSPVDHELLANTRELGVGVVAWSPLGSGFLTGTVQQVTDDDFRRHIPGFRDENLKANNDRFAPVRAIAAELDLTPSQLALAWLLHQYEHVVPIPGSRAPAHIAENLAAARVELAPDTLTRIDQALSAFVPEGTSTLLNRS